MSSQVCYNTDLRQDSRDYSDRRFRFQFLHHEMESANISFTTACSYNNSHAEVMDTKFGIKSVNYLFPVMIIVATMLSILAIATAFGNLLVGLALLRYRRLRTISNCLIGNLALSDFLLATTVIPFSIANECLGYWIFGPLLCRAWLVIDVLYCTASI